MRAVIFDMDGVLFDTERLAVRCWDEIGETLGLGRVGYMVFKTLGRTTEESVKIFEKEFKERFDNDAFQAEYKRWLDTYYKNNPVPVKDGVFETLKYLNEHGFKTAVASSSSKRSVMHHLKDAGLEGSFDAIICGDMIAKSKPEPDIYLAAAKALGESPKDCYAIEDSKSGLLSAHRAGCRVVYIPDIYEADDETLKAVDEKYSSMTEFLNSLL